MTFCGADTILNSIRWQSRKVTICVSEVFVWSTVVLKAITVVLVFFGGLVVVLISIVIDWVFAVVVVAALDLFLGRHDHTLQITGERCHLRAVRFHLIKAATSFERRNCNIRRRESFEAHRIVCSEANQQCLAGGNNVGRFLKVRF